MYGSSISVWYSLLENLEVISLSRIATVMDTTVPATMKTRLYKTVFFVMFHASEDANKYLKLLNPAQSLPRMPLFQLIFLNAITSPNMGA